MFCFLVICQWTLYLLSVSGDRYFSWTLFFKMGEFQWTFSEGEFSWTLLVTSRGHFLTKRISFLGEYSCIFWMNSSGYFLMVITNIANTVQVRLVQVWVRFGLGFGQLQVCLRLGLCQIWVGFGLDLGQVLVRFGLSLCLGQVRYGLGLD